MKVILLCSFGLSAAGLFSYFCLTANVQRAHGKTRSPLARAYGAVHEPVRRAAALAGTGAGSRRAPDFMAQTGPRFVIVPTSLATKLFSNHPEDRKMFSTRGFNIAKGEHVELTLVLKPD